MIRTNRERAHRQLQKASRIASAHRLQVRSTAATPSRTLPASPSITRDGTASSLVLVCPSANSLPASSCWSAAVTRRIKRPATSSPQEPNRREILLSGHTANLVFSGELRTSLERWPGRISCPGSLALMHRPAPCWSRGLNNLSTMRLPLRDGRSHEHALPTLQGRRTSTSFSPRSGWVRRWLHAKAHLRHHPAQLRPSRRRDHSSWQVSSRHSQAVRLGVPGHWRCRHCDTSAGGALGVGLRDHGSRGF